MNIKTRIKKLEKATNAGGFCACGQLHTEIYLQNLGENATTNEPILSGEPVPDVCPDCRKPTEKNKITVQICDASTPERFPEEWNAKRQNQN